MKRQMMDVELVGGPMDGAELEVRVNDPGFDVYLFRRDKGPDGEDGREVLAYAFRGRSLCGNGRWALEFLYQVARVGKRVSTEEKKGGAA
jgi:hypothetical protein